jgi:diacylglycerol O-acyltransferase / wax synthase
MLTHPVATGRHVLAAWPAMRELLADRPLPATSLDRLVGPHRNLALIQSSLELVKEVAHSSDATVNDVLLTVTAGGLRGLLSSRGEPVDGAVLRIYVPVSLHQEPQGQARGNLIAQMVVPLPIGVPDPGLRLQLIAKETAQRKAKSRPSLGMVPHRGIAGRAFLKLLDRQRVNVTSADVPGPEMPLYFAGARLLEGVPDGAADRKSVTRRGGDVVCGTVQHHGGRRQRRLPRYRRLQHGRRGRAASSR